MFRIIVVFCLLFIIGSFFGLLVISSMKSKKKWLKAITFIIVASAFASIFTFVIISEAENDESLYNNGICTHCDNGHYEFTSVTQTKNCGKHVYYKCDNCGYVIETNHLYQ